MRLRPLSMMVVAAIALAVGAGCADDDAGDQAEGPAAPDEAEQPVSAPSSPEPSDPGTGTVVVGATSSPFDVETCRLEADPAQPAGAQTLVSITGAGTTPDGIAFTLEVQRFATGTDVRTFTDTVVYSDAARILQVQRVEVGGEVTDLRDPDATGPLIRLRADGVSLSGLASGPGEDQDDGGLIGLAVDATCP